MCRSWFYKAPNTPLRKADHLSLAIGDMVCPGVCIAIECSYKLDQKHEFKFLYELCTFLQIRSHIFLETCCVRLLNFNVTFFTDSNLNIRFEPNYNVLA